MEENNFENQEGMSPRKMFFLLIGVIGVVIIILFFSLFTPFRQGDLAPGRASDLLSPEAVLDISVNNQERSDVLEGGSRVNKREDKLAEVGFDSLAGDDPLLRDDVRVKYNKKVDVYPKKIEFGAGFSVDSERGEGGEAGITGLVVSGEQVEGIEGQTIGFLKKYSAVLDVDVEELEIKTEGGVGEFETIDFKQVYQGVPVYLSSTSFAKSGNKLTLFVSNFLHDIDLSVKPEISEQDAVEKAKSYSGISEDPVNDLELFIYPSFGEAGAIPKLVYKIDFPVVSVGADFGEGEGFLDVSRGIYSTNSEREILINEGDSLLTFGSGPFEKSGVAGNVSFSSVYQLSVFVDAHMGEIVDAVDNIREDDFSGRSFGEVFPEHYGQERIEVGLANQNILNVGDEVLTDSEGAYLFEEFLGGDIEAKYTGPYVKVVDYGNGGQEYSFSIDSSEERDLNFSELDESYKREATNMFYHVNVIHDFFTTGGYPFNVSALNFQMNAELNDRPDCNAWADGTSIHFFQPVENVCETLSLSSDVIYHEYTHNMVAQLAPELNSVYWGHTGNMNEGYADYFACSINNNSCVADNFFYGFGLDCLRNCDNSMRFPEQYDPEPHTASETISGAMWDLRALVGREVADSLAMLALDYDPQTFQELADNFVIVDDSFYGDGDVTNGVPHGEEICESFYTNHGIYSDYCFNILPLVGILDLPEKIEGQRYLNITGSVGGTELERWELEIYDSNKNSVVSLGGEDSRNGIILENFDLYSIFTEGGVEVYLRIYSTTSDHISKVSDSFELNNFEITRVGDTYNYVNGKKLESVYGGIFLENYSGFKIELQSEDGVLREVCSSLVPVSSGRVMCEGDFSGLKNGEFVLNFSIFREGKMYSDISSRVFSVPELMGGWPVEMLCRGSLILVSSDLSKDGSSEVLTTNPRRCSGGVGINGEMNIFESDASYKTIYELYKDGLSIANTNWVGTATPSVAEGNVALSSIHRFSGIVDERGNFQENWPYDDEKKTFSETSFMFDGKNLFNIRGHRSDGGLYLYGFDKNGGLLDNFPVEIKKEEGFEAVSLLRQVGLIKEGDKSFLGVLSGFYNNFQESNGKLFFDIYSEDGELVKRTLLSDDSLKEVSYRGLSFASADLNGDGNSEIAVGYMVFDLGSYYDDGAYNLSTYKSYLKVLDSRGNIISEPYRVDGYGLSNIRIGNLGRETPQIVFNLQDTFPTTYNGQQIIAMDYTGEVLFDFRLEDYNKRMRGISIGDVTGDGISNVVVSYSPRWWRGEPSGLLVYGKKGLVREIIIPTSGDTEYLNWGSDPVLTDFDGDGNVDILLKSWYLPRNRGGDWKAHIFSFDMGVPYNLETMGWSQFQRNAQHTNCYDCPETVQREFQSKIFNKGISDISGNLIMKVQKKSGNNWEDYGEFYDFEVAVPAGENLNLGEGDRGEFPGWNNLDVVADEVGDYRVYVEFEGGSSSWEFSVID
jgi:hypothetical protein